MPSPRALYYACLALLIAVAWGVAARDRTHRFYAACLATQGFADAVHITLVAVRRGLAHPRVGLGRAIFHLDQLAVIANGFLLAGACVAYFVGRGTRWVVVACFATWLVFFDFPYFTFGRLAMLYRVVALGTQLAAWLAIAYGIFFRRGVQPRLAHLCLLVAAATEVVLSIVPYARDLYGGWDLVRYAGLANFTVAIGAHCWWLATRRRASDQTAVA